MTEIRIKDIMSAKGFTNTSLAEKMGVTKQAVGKMVKAESLTLITLQKIADALDVPIWQMFVSKDEIIKKKSDFAAFVRFKGIHYVSDNLDEFLNQVEEIKLIAK